MRVTKRLRSLPGASATLVMLCLAWCWATCSPAVGQVPTSAGVPSASPGQQVWASTPPGLWCCLVGAVSPDQTTVYVSGFVDEVRGHPRVKRHFETIAYGAATGAQLWASSYQDSGFGRTVAITASPDGATVYMTAETEALHGPPVITVAYNARTGRQLWASGQPKGMVSGLAVSPDGTTLYLTGNFAQSEFTVIAYAAATGKQRWLRDLTGKPGYAESVAVSPDGKTVYATGSAGSSALTVAYGTAGTLKWAARYKDPYGFSAGSQIGVAPSGDAVYVAGKAANKNRHIDVATFAYRAATGSRMWLDRHDARITTGLLPAPDIAVTPGGQTVILTVPVQGGASYDIAAYDSSTGGTQWAKPAPSSSGMASGLVINPAGDTMFIGGNRTTAYSVADGTMLWATSYDSGFPLGGLEAGIIGLSGGGTRVFGTRQIHGRITIIAYQT